MAKTANDHDESQGIHHARLKRDIDLLSSIFDKESKANLINTSCRHSYPTVNNKRTIDQSKDTARPPTKRRTTNNEQKIEAAFNPGKEILDEGKGKKKVHTQFIKTTANATSTRQKPEQTNDHETTGLLPGLAAPTL
jgi:hypothetical protein